MPSAIIINTHETYIPTWGNKDRADDEKITVTWKHLTVKEQNSLFKVSRDAEGKAVIDSEKEAEFIAMTEKVENLTVLLDGEEVEIKNGKDIVDTPRLDGLYLELKKHYVEREAVDSKNLK